MLLGPFGYPQMERYVRHTKGEIAPPMDEAISISRGGHWPISANGTTTIANVAIEFATD